MGEVFRARDSRLKRTVALKVMKKKIAATPSSRKRFVEEARSMAAVHHDNVATIFEVGIHRNMPFMAMEMLQGQPLDVSIKGTKRFHPDDVLRVAKEVARGLAAAHQCGIIHRDIKPANIWIEEPTGRAKILDFGLAIAGANLDHLSPRGSVVGSPGYLAPEQARNEPVDDRTDLYSLGVVLYQMCDGELPLRSDTISGQLIAIICHEPAPLGERNADVPGPLRELIHRLLSKEPRDRPSSAVQLEQLVDAAAKRCEMETQGALQIVTESPAAKPGRQTAKEAQQPPSNQKSILPWVVSASLLVLVTGLAWWFSRPRRVASEPAPQVEARAKPQSKKTVTAESLQPLALTTPTGTDTVTGGDAARYRMRISNAAVDSASDPRQINAGAKVAARIVTLLKHSGTPQVQRPTFAKRFSATQLPRPGESKEIEIQFLTGDLPPKSFEVQFELQSPSGHVIRSTSANLRVKENLGESDLLGFDLLRTRTGRGADTYVRSGSSDDLGGKNALQALRTAGQKEQEHIYLRFDLSKSEFPHDELDRAMLLLTVQPGGHQSTSEFTAYGIVSGLAEDWTETGDGHLTWLDSPCRDGIGGQQYLGELSMGNSKDRPKNVSDGVRLFGDEFDDFLRSVSSDLVTIVLIRNTQSEKPSLFKSREGKPKEAPALAMRRRTEPAP